MECREVQRQIEPYFDGELSLSDKRAVEEHLERCTDCARVLTSLQVLNTAIKQKAAEQAPAGLRRWLRRQLRQTRRQPEREWLSWLGLSGGAVALVALLTWGVASLVSMPPVSSPLEEVIGAHVRSLMVDHVTDIASADRHEVKPWFQGKLDFAPPVHDFSDRGFPLLGGRLDYLQQRPAAALAYRRRAHVINVFIWPSHMEGDTALKRQSYQGYHIVRWRKAGLEYWLVSDLNVAELMGFATLVRGKEPADKING